MGRIHSFAFSFFCRVDRVRQHTIFDCLKFICYTITFEIYIHVYNDVHMLVCVCLFACIPYRLRFPPPLESRKNHTHPFIRIAFNLHQDENTIIEAFVQLSRLVFARVRDTNVYVNFTEILFHFGSVTTTPILSFQAVHNNSVNK